MSRPTTPIPNDVTTQALLNTGENEQDAILSESKPKAKKTKAPDTITREPGKSLLPHARVQKILKADKELIMVQREAAFLISRATEEFIYRIAEAAQNVAAKERRTTVQAKDLAASVRRAEEFAFLEELLPWLDPEPSAPGRRKPPAPDGKKSTGKSQADSKTTLDQFVKKSARDETADEDGEDGQQMSVVMNEDGTMSTVLVETES